MWTFSRIYEVHCQICWTKMFQGLKAVTWLQCKVLSYTKHKPISVEHMTQHCRVWLKLSSCNKQKALEGLLSMSVDVERASRWDTNDASNKHRIFVHLTSSLFMFDKGNALQLNKTRAQLLQKKAISSSFRTSLWWSPHTAARWS